jgi:hypothetical protein
MFAGTWPAMTLSATVLIVLSITCSVTPPAVAYQDSPGSVQVLVTTREILTQPCQFTAFPSADRVMFTLHDGTTRSLSRDEFWWWNGPPARVDQPLVYLVNGSVLAGHVQWQAESEIRVASRWWRPLDLPRQAVRCVELQIPLDEALRQRRLDEMLKPNEQTRVWLTNGDMLAGVSYAVSRNRNFRLSLGGRSVSIPFGLIAGISFGNPATSAELSADSHGWCLSLADGSRLVADRFEFADDTLQARRADLSLELQRRDGVAGSQPLESLVCGIRNRQLDGTCLSRQQPLRQDHRPWLGPPAPLRMNRNIRGASIRFGNTMFPFGIGTHSRSSVIFGIPQASGETWLQTGVAMDPSAGCAGTVSCRVLKLNRDNQWETCWTGTLRGGDEQPQFLRLPLADSRAVALVVDYGEAADVRDRVNWIMPQVLLQ